MQSEFIGWAVWRDNLQLATLKSRLRYICILSFSALLPLPLEDKNLFHFSLVCRSKLALDVRETLRRILYLSAPHCLCGKGGRERERVRGVASNWHRLHAARHHHKETRRRQKFFNFCYNFYHLQLPQLLCLLLPQLLCLFGYPPPARQPSPAVGGTATGHKLCKHL